MEGLDVVLQVAAAALSQCVIIDTSLNQSEEGLKSCSLFSTRSVVVFRVRRISLDVKFLFHNKMDPEAT